MLDQSPKYFIYDNACHLQPFINSHNTLTNNRLEILKAYFYAYFKCY